MKIEQFEFSGEGMNKVYSNENWMVGLKNWKYSNDINGFTNIERHNETDELFILLDGECTLIYAEEQNKGLTFDYVMMKPYKVYNIPKGLWHNTITNRNTKLALIEHPSTSMKNSEVKELENDQIEEIKALLV